MSDDDRISAFLDGELDDSSRHEFMVDLEADAALRAEFDAVAEVRRLLRSSPVEPPSGTLFVPAGIDVSPADPVVVPLRRPRRRRRFIAAAAAVVVVVMVGLGGGIPGTDVVPPVDALASRHTMAVEAMPEAVPDERFHVMPPDEMTDLGPDMPGMPMVAAYQTDDTVQLMYGDGAETVSVFRQDGRLDEMPMPDVEPMELDAGTALHVTTDATEVVVIERDEVVFTVVGAPGHLDTVVDMAGSVPGTDRGWVETARRWLGAWR